MDKSSSKLEKTVTSIALLCVGVCFVVWADKVTDWIAIAFGVIALIYAFVKLVKFINTNPEKRTTLPLLYIILSAAAGILLVSRADFIKEAISFVVGVYIILTCSIQLLGISSLRRHASARVSSLAWPIIGIIVGILCITGQFIIPNELARLTGVVLIIYAIVYLTGARVTESAAKKTTKKEDYKKIEEAVIVKEEKSAKPSPSKKK